MRLTISWMRRLPTVLAGLLLSTIFITFLKNAWVSEDAYIIFRSIEQLFAGHGPVWNPHERVQVFTSPLWFWVLALGRWFSSDLYVVTLTTSLILWAATLLALKKLFCSWRYYSLALLLLLASNGFYDFTTSGLENGLAYFLLVLYLYFYNQLALSANTSRHIVTHLRCLLFVAGLLLCVRHDLGLLLAWPTWAQSKRYRLSLTNKQWFYVISTSLFPFMAWTAFSVFYYGFPFPNTAYAKLQTQTPFMEKLIQGTHYFLFTILFDPITLFIIFMAVCMGMLQGIIVQTDKEPYYSAYRELCLGVGCYLLYILWIGGDFMAGRFFSYPYLISVVLVSLKLKANHCKQLGYWFLVIAYIILFPHTPVNSPLWYSNRTIVNGIADERGWYQFALSLAAYIEQRQQGAPFPNYLFANVGRTFKNSADPMRVCGNIGMVGYFAGTNKVIVDVLGLSDPLLARLPALPNTRIGHFIRALPKGYLSSVALKTPAIKDVKLNTFYKQLSILNQDKPLFSWQRLKTIVWVNIGLAPTIPKTYETTPLKVNNKQAVCVVLSER